MVKLSWPRKKQTWFTTFSAWILCTIGFQSYEIILCPQDVTQRALSFLIDSIASALLYVYHDMAQLIFSKIRIWMVVSDNALRLSKPDILQVKIW